MFSALSGSFKWENGDPVTYTNWAFGYPKLNGTNICVYMDYLGFWYDTRCDNLVYLYICSVKKLPSGGFYHDRNFHLISNRICITVTEDVDDSADGDFDYLLNSTPEHVLEYESTDEFSESVIPSTRQNAKSTTEANIILSS